ncbi:radical SAM protein [Frisingicoccus caecimuris]|uniref:MoaA/NifB/PqqE/SkfB family radical SAM enzyme n=1 Tax=Frisingicoccus caecimuris TaxID=1796636 RepID=A0A4R2L8B5_9FIRM|nr:radical SAM protein [Frisingicoccus caecimuris]MCR1919992.1 radical SAM protein [Frisingicoccus caecimuris]TCO81602.1 MoaA/NifB/PqqE/SkfB family radical SAM enzyme [Frisingicoccus caecimuris]
MKKSDLFTKLAPYLFDYRLNRWFDRQKFQPMTVTYSVTAACQSRCKTCQIGQMFCNDPSRPEKDLKLDEIEKIFKTMKPVYFFNMSGGEPFMRKDLPQIVTLACKYLKPRVIHTPTNAIMSKTIIANTEKIIKIIRRYDPTVPFTVKPSIDGVGELHDEIRGVKGNFDKLLETIEGLKKLEEKYDNFHLELGTVISNFNINHLDEIEDFVHSLGVESYRNEVAECRTEFFNLDDPITPPADVYQKLIKDFSRKVEENIGKKKSLAKTTEAMRVVYYDLAGKILETHTQVIPCYAGVSNVHINYDGGVWPCCVLGYDKEMGNLREFNYDFQKLWYSPEAKQVRKYIKEKNCACPLANQAYSNELMHFPSLVKAGIKTIQYARKG